MIMLVIVDVANDLARVVAFYVQREFRPSWASMKKFATCMMGTILAGMLLEALSARETRFRLINPFPKRQELLKKAHKLFTYVFQLRHSTFTTYFI
jgi:hypothetical protein